MLPKFREKKIVHFQIFILRSTLHFAPEVEAVAGDLPVGTFTEIPSQVLSDELSSCCPLLIIEVFNSVVFFVSCTNPGNTPCPISISFENIEIETGLVSSGNVEIELGIEERRGSDVELREFHG
uniref:Uncharacterized protein n=1 Tax=Cucumis melo TaxID=3656 RepID=A0A9I9E9W2_CUCME